MGKRADEREAGAEKIPDSTAHSTVRFTEEQSEFLDATKRKVGINRIHNIKGALCAVLSVL